MNVLANIDKCLLFYQNIYSKFITTLFHFMFLGYMYQKSNERVRIKSIHSRKILNSHVDFVNEFLVELNDGTIGIGSYPKGETISIYEKQNMSLASKKGIEKILINHFSTTELNQVEFDAFLQRKMKIFDPGDCFALSLAFFNANERSHGRLQKSNHTLTKSSCLACFSTISMIP